eukprot:7383866-Prymnesium_polylepis.5
MAEFVMDPENRAEPGSMRAAYLKQLYVNEKDRGRRIGARVHPTADWEVLSCNGALRETAVLALCARKVIYAEMLCGMSPFEKVAARPDETPGMRFCPTWGHIRARPDFFSDLQTR